MSQGYRVEIKKLRDVARDLRDRAEHLGTIRTTMRGAAVADAAFGHTDKSREAAAAWRQVLAEFDRRIDKSGQKLDREAHTLTTVAASYEKADQHIAKLFVQVKWGDIGQSVLELQRNLRDRGINPGPIDGVYGSKTAHAIEEFHRLHPEF